MPVFVRDRDLYAEITEQPPTSTKEEALREWVDRAFVAGSAAPTSPADCMAWAVREIDTLRAELTAVRLRAVQDRS